MEIAIVGLASSGKSTLFEIMTGVKSREIFNEQVVRGIAKIPDQRHTELVKIFNPKRSVPATIPFVDLCQAKELSWDALRNVLGGTDAILHVVDGFTATSADEIISRYKKISDEFILSDLVVVESRLSRLTKVSKATMKPEEASHLQILPLVKEALEAGKPIREMNLSAMDAKTLRGFTFWSQKPEIVVINAKDDNPAWVEELKKHVSPGTDVITIQCQIELEIAELPPEERLSFLESMGIASPAFERIIQSAFAGLGRICYFTVGEDEVRAWVVEAGSTAPKAAAAIHKDFERGFIKAEVVAYDDFIASGKSFAGVKSAGKFRLEGKEYIVKDGDLITFRFNV